MYVGRKHTVTATTQKLFPFVCPHCNHEAFALVTGVGQGAGNSPYFLDEGGAKERASSQANDAATENAAATLLLARCPSCFQRDEGAVRAVKGKAIAGALACLFIFPIFGLGLDAMHSGRSSAGLFIFAPLGALTAYFIYASQKWKWETADNRVSFFSKEELEAEEKAE